MPLSQNMDNALTEYFKTHRRLGRFYKSQKWQINDWITTWVSNICVDYPEYRQLVLEVFDDKLSSFLVLLQQAWAAKMSEEDAFKTALLNA